jgi:hypothetical protein
MAKMANISGTGNMRVFAAASQTPHLAPGEVSAHGPSVRVPRLARRSSRRARRVIRR